MPLLRSALINAFEHCFFGWCTEVKKGNHIASFYAKSASDTSNIIPDCPNSLDFSRFVVDCASTSIHRKNVIRSAEALFIAEKPSKTCVFSARHALVGCKVVVFLRSAPKRKFLFCSCHMLDVARFCLIFGKK